MNKICKYYLYLLSGFSLPTLAIVSVMLFLSFLGVEKMFVYIYICIYIFISMFIIFSVFYVFLYLTLRKMEYTIYNLVRGRGGRNFLLKLYFHLFSFFSQYGFSVSIFILRGGSLIMKFSFFFFYHTFLFY